MAIQFNNIPDNLRVPLFYAEVNAAQSPYQSIRRLLLIGQMDTANGTATPGEPIQLFTNAEGLFGPYAMITQMAKVARANAPIQEIWALPLADEAVSVKASGSWLCRVASGAVALADANVTLVGGAPSTVDGVALSAGDLVLATAQTAGAENGLYEVTVVGTGADGTWTRAASMNADPEAHPNRTFKIASGGATYGGTTWEITNAAAITLNTTAITFAQLAKNVAVVSQATTVAVWIAGVRVRTIVYTTDTALTLAARLAAAINASEYPLPVTAAVGATAGVDDHTVVLTARHGGEASNSIGLDLNYYGQEGPTSQYVFEATAMSGGTGDPDIQAELANLGDEEFDWIAAPYNDATNLGYISDFMNGASGRWSPYKQIYGHYITAINDTATNRSTFGATLNDPHISIMGYYNSPTPNWEWAAAVGAKAAKHLQTAPELSRPLQTINLIGIKAPKAVSDRDDIVTRQSLYYDGMSGYHVEKDGTVSIDRLITTYQLNEWGDPDASFLDVNTIAQTMYGLRYLKAKVQGQWGRAALADDNPFGVQGLATPADVRATFVHGYRELIADGVYENLQEFEQSLIVERNATDANRLDVYLPADKVNQLRIIAVNYTSFLQFGQQLAA